MVENSSFYTLMKPVMVVISPNLSNKPKSQLIKRCRWIITLTF